MKVFFHYVEATSFYLAPSYQDEVAAIKSNCIIDREGPGIGQFY